jgi:hypothetical protein
MSWLIRTEFNFLRSIDKELHGIVRNFKKVNSAFRKKINLFKELRKEYSQKNIKKLSTELNQLKNLLGISLKFMGNELTLVSKAVSNIEKIISKEIRRDREDKRLKYKEYKDLIALKHFIEVYCKLIFDQINFFRKNQTAAQISHNILEFSIYLDEESRILGLEKEALKVLELETEELEKEKLDVVLVGYGSFMRTRQVGIELKKALGELTDFNIRQKIKERAFPVTVYGWKRIFDKEAARGVWETEEDKLKKRVAALDIHPAPYHYFNGVAIRLTNKEFRAFIEREKYYGLIELRDVRHFVTGEHVRERCMCFKSEIFRIREQWDVGPFANRLSRYDITPIPKYFATCVIGSKGLDSLLNAPGMFATFLKTTYLYYYDKKMVYHGEITVFELIQIRNKERKLRRELK